MAAAAGSASICSSARRLRVHACSRRVRASAKYATDQTADEKRATVSMMSCWRRWMRVGAAALGIMRHVPKMRCAAARSSIVGDPCNSTDWKARSALEAEPLRLNF